MKSTFKINKSKDGGLVYRARFMLDETEPPWAGIEVTPIKMPIPGKVYQVATEWTHDSDMAVAGKAMALVHSRDYGGFDNGKGELAYHGWVVSDRSTRIYARGVRICLSAELIGNQTRAAQIVVAFGPDQKPPGESHDL